MRHASLILLLVACTETRDPLEGTQSIEVEMVTPAIPGDVNNRITERVVVVNLIAKDAKGNIDTTFRDRSTYPECNQNPPDNCPCKPIGKLECGPVRVYAQFLGTLTPELNEMPLATISMTDGIAQNQTINVPATVFGPTTLWFDNGVSLGPDYRYGALTGNSPTLWYRDPFIQDLQRPRDEMAVDALSVTPLTDKQIRVGASRHGAQGALVITSIFAQGYTVSDVQCATGGAMPTPPCTAGDYDHAMVFTFSSPRDQYGRPLVEGEVIESFNGGLSEFNGLTEVGFPRTFISAPDRDTPPFVNRALMPPPALFDLMWFGPLSTPTGRINFEKNEAGAVEFPNLKVCPIDDNPEGVYARFKQWTVDPDPAGMCLMATSDQRSKLINLITAGTDFTTDPHTLVGRTLPKVIGIVRPVNLGSFNVWIVYPRGKDEVQTQ